MANFAGTCTSDNKGLLLLLLLLFCYYLCEFKCLKLKINIMWLKTVNSCQVKSSHLYLYSAFNNTNCNKALHNIKIGKFVNNVK